MEATMCGLTRAACHLDAKRYPVTVPKLTVIEDARAISIEEGAVHGSDIRDHDRLTGHQPVNNHSSEKLRTLVSGCSQIFACSRDITGLLNQAL